MLRNTTNSGVGSLLNNAKSYEIQSEIMQASTRHEIGSTGTKTALITLSIPTAIIWGGELITLAPTIGVGLNNISWGAGWGYNYLNLIFQRGGYELVKYGTANILLSPRLNTKVGNIGTKLFVDLIYHSKRTDYNKLIATKIIESQYMPSQNIGQ